MSATLTPPELMQRFAALDRGNDVRIRRAQLKRDLHDRTRRIEEVVREPEWWMLTMPVCELLGYAPRIGPVRVNRILRRADVWPRCVVRAWHPDARRLGGQLEEGSVGA